MRKLDNWISSYIDFTSDLEAPDQFHFWAAVHGIGTALSGKCWFDMGKFKWRPSFYITFVAPPGIATKSTTVGAIEEMLDEVGDINYGPTSVTWQAMFDAFVEAMETTVCRNAHTSVQNVTHSSLCLQVSELGNFLDLYDNKFIDFLVDVWDNREKGQKRKTRGGGEISFKTPCLNMIGATTPAWLKGNMPQYMISGGLTSRMIFVAGDKKRQFVAYPFTQNTAGSKELRENLVHDLRQIAGLSGQFILTPEALQKGQEWYEAYWGSLPAHLRDERMLGYASRKQCHVHKLAMVLSAARDDSMVITLQDIDSALLIMSSLEGEMTGVLDVVGENEGVKQLATVLGLVRSQGPLTKTKLFRLCCTRMDYRAFEIALTGAMAAGHIKQIVSASGITLEATKPEKGA